MRGTFSLAALVAAAAASPVLQRRTPCQTQNSGAGPVQSPDTPSAFASATVYASIASAAPTPAGYVANMIGFNASNNGDQYLTYTTVPSYDPNLCASKCNSITGCKSFNIYFERDPTLDADPSACPNPSSTTNIKCSFWGAPLTLASANNFGQWRASFQVLIAGSNSYNAQPAYTGSSIGTNAIEAPLSCIGSDTYIGVETFQVSTLDISLCNAACTRQNAYAYAHPPQNGPVKACQFWNGYLQYVNGSNPEQHCSMYSQTWNATYATNAGQWRNGNDLVTIQQSVIYSNTSAPGICVPALPIAY